ncbi:dTDP-4-dehydrorhamnose reductase [uncultured Desulfuromonas sp.]|uniref:dTDP-4-dehydrorhamnose reductase n=1 Tax=uncultured Desulfuromonas sp. TaxID=181013 RepID=UPI002AAC33FA|nr:dTDP-4-dehydrorhamnose reductase [uncultured Desulfuromonas sp.]
MSERHIALIGANGMLASMLRATVPPSVVLHLLDLPEFDLTRCEDVRSCLSVLSPEIIINCAAFTQVDACESERELAMSVNGDGPACLADVAHELDATLVHFSTDFVFSGTNGTPYQEDDAVGPLSVYGESKLRGEQGITGSRLQQYYIVRTSWLYGPNGANFVETMIRLAHEREELKIVADQIGTPTYTGDLAAAVWRLLGLDESGRVAAPYGLYHYSNDGVCSWYDFTCEIVRWLQNEQQSLQVKTVRPIATQEYPVPAVRPAYSVLSKAKIIHEADIVVPSWQQSLHRYLRQRFSGR